MANVRNIKTPVEGAPGLCLNAFGESFPKGFPKKAVSGLYRAVPLTFFLASLLVKLKRWCNNSNISNVVWTKKSDKQIISRTPKHGQTDKQTANSRADKH